MKAHNISNNSRTVVRGTLNSLLSFNQCKSTINFIFGVLSSTNKES